MKIRIVALVAIALLATTAVALAKTNTLTGKLKRYPEAKVKVKVKLSKKGVASKVTSFNLTNIPSKCSNQRGDDVPGKTVASVKLGKFKVRTIKAEGTTTYYASKNVNIGGNQWNLDARFSSKKAKKLSGSVTYNYSDPNPNGGGTCDGGGQFTVKKK